MTDQWLQVSDDTIRDHAYLIARGVRALALIGHGPAQSGDMLALMGRLEVLGTVGAIPFVLDRGDGVCDYGYAARSWVVDLYRWCMGRAGNTETTKQKHRIIGLLLGYSPSAIASYDDGSAGRLFFSPDALAQP